MERVELPLCFDLSLVTAFPVVPLIVGMLLLNRKGSLGCYSCFRQRWGGEVCLFWSARRLGQGQILLCGCSDEAMPPNLISRVHPDLFLQENRGGGPTPQLVAKHNWHTLLSPISPSNTSISSI